jgi:hypothetical protein
MAGNNSTKGGDQDILSLLRLDARRAKHDKMILAETELCANDRPLSRARALNLFGIDAVRAMRNLWRGEPALPQRFDSVRGPRDDSGAPTSAP